MKDVFKIELTHEKIILILNAFIRGDLSSDELKAWVVSVMDAKEHDGILEYDTVVSDIILDIEMSEAHIPITRGRARDFIRELSSYTNHTMK